MKTNNTVIELKNVAKVYSSSKLSVSVLHDVNLVVNQGEFIAIMGPSGSGKSTLLNILGLLDKSSEGVYKLLNTEISKYSDDQLATLRNCYFGFVFQQFNLLQKLTILENVLLPLIYSNSENYNVCKYEEIKKLLCDLGLSKRLNHCPNEISGGQQQRTAVARALVNKPNVILADEPTGNLDTKSSNEVMKILKKLNNSGITVIMVTHEHELSTYADRIVRIQDGTILSDENNHQVKVKNAISYAQIKLLTKKNTFSLKKIKNYFMEAIRTIRTSKMRSILSILGITMGTASLIAMLAVGNGTQRNIEKQFESLSAKNLLEIYPDNSRQRAGSSSDQCTYLKFKKEDVFDIRNNVDGIKSISGNVFHYVTIVANDKNCNTKLKGASVEYLNLENTTVDMGNSFTEADDMTRRKVVLLGKTVVEKIYGSKDFNPIGKHIKINNISFQVIGVFSERGSQMSADYYNDRVVIPLNTAIYRICGAKNRCNLGRIDCIEVQVKNDWEINKVSNKIVERLLFIHKIPIYAKHVIKVSNWAEHKKAATSSAKALSFLLGIISIISLLVGGTGIMNIMLVSVSERTREIGLRKTVGATEKDVLFQFIVESVLMCCLGGIIGIVFGSVMSIILVKISMLAKSFNELKILITSFSLEIAFCSSVLIGLTFGILPAKKAAKLNPIDALRHN
jgi:macrolide transport system ATP-binding/permease protein